AADAAAGQLLAAGFVEAATLQPSAKGAAVAKAGASAALLSLSSPPSTSPAKGGILWLGISSKPVHPKREMEICSKRKLSPPLFTLRPATASERHTEARAAGLILTALEL